MIKSKRYVNQRIFIKMIAIMEVNATWSNSNEALNGNTQEPIDYHYVIYMKITKSSKEMQHLSNQWHEKSKTIMS